MAKPAVSRDAFRGLFAFYAAKAHHDDKAEGKNRLLRLFGSAEYIPDRLLQQWSETADLLGPETVETVAEPRACKLASGGRQYDHASDFLHALLRDLGQKCSDQSRSVMAATAKHADFHAALAALAIKLTFYEIFWPSAEPDKPARPLR